MKKIFIIIIVVILSVSALLWLYYSNNDKNTGSNYTAERSSTNIKTKEEKTTRKETEISAFQTKIYSKDEERQNNISITCKALNSTEVKPGETFSFCNTVGKASTDKGYEKADIFVDGKKTQGLGGGNCQVSTTLYNAVQAVNGLEIVERHQHSSYVPYIEKGKDAAVAYGSYDFKFKNNRSNTIKILMENTAENIRATIIEII